jgi:hypothetical protein
LKAAGNFICISEPEGRNARGRIPIVILVDSKALLSELLIMMAAGVFGRCVRIENKAD